MQDRQAVLSGLFADMSEGLSLRKACQKRELAHTTVLGWIDADAALGDQYAGARARMLDAQAEALEDLGEKASLAETAVEVAGLRLQSDNRKWLLSKLAPKKYGDKLDLAHSGSIKHQMTDLSDDDLAAIAAGSGG